MKNKKFYAAMLATALGLTVMQGFATEAEVERDLRGASKISILAETDFKKDSGYPIIAIREKPLELTIDGMASDYTVYVQGNGREKEVTLQSGKWVYKPDNAGIFEVQVRDGRGKVIETRKVYVRPKNAGDYYQLKDTEIFNKPMIDVIDPLGLETTTGSAYQVYNEVTTTGAYRVQDNKGWLDEIEDEMKEEFLEEVYPIEKYIRPLTFKSKLGTKQISGTTVMGFTVGESHFPQKTILSKEINGSTFTMREGHEIDLGTGHYRVESFVKDSFSTEMQDHKVDTYKRDNPTFHQLTSVNGKENVEFEVEKKGDRYKAQVKAKCHMGCDLEYAFLVTDYAGTRVIRDYAEGGKGNTDHVFIEDLNWDFTVHVRVKHKEDIDWREGGDVKVGNSYEVQLSEEVKINHKKVPITSVIIEPSAVGEYYQDKGADHMGGKVHQVLIDGPKESEYPVQSNGQVLVKNKNYITIDIDESQIPEGNKVEYKAWVIDDGHWTLLKDYADKGENGVGNTFVYYPLSGGSAETTLYPDRTHTLVISVREKDKKENIVGVREETITLEVH